MFSPDISYITAQTALWGYVVAPSFPLSVIMLMGSIVIRLAEIATIILCTCFPMMPRFVRLVSEHYTSSKASSSSPMTNKGGLKTARVGKTQSSTGIHSEGQEEEDMAWLQSPYQQLGDRRNEGSEPDDVVKSLGTKRKVDIEMPAWDQLDAKSRAASMV